MAFSKVTLNGATLMDVTDTSAAAGDVASGKYFYGADGVKTEGTSSGGGGITPAEAKDVNFIDYDGTIVYSYTKSEFAQLSALPANPTHAGLTAQGWNWSLSDAKTHVATYGKLWIGQMYVTSSGKTEIDIELNNPDLLSPYLKFCLDGTAVVDWGDGSGTDTVTGTSIATAVYTPHTYATAGNYTISISMTSGSFTFRENYILSHTNGAANASRRYISSIIAVRLGNGISSIGTFAFNNCHSLRSVTIPSSISSIGTYAFRYCHSLRSVIIPSGQTTIGNYVFANCSSLQSVSLPNSITSIGTQVFYYCYTLQSVTLPNSMISLGNNVFYNCHSLQNITIPSGTTSIGSNAFPACYSLYKIVFKPTTPPSVNNNAAWTDLSTDCIIYVPYSADHSVLAAYQSATNYPDPNTYTYMEET